MLSRKIYKKMKISDEIINRLMNSQGYNTKKELAKNLGISAPDLNNRIKSGTVKQLLIDHAIHKKVNIDWLLTGQGNMKNEQYETSATLSSPIFDTDTAYQPKINTADLVHKMKAVLRSNTAYSTALKDIILAYYEATICQEELAEQQKESS
ncbi:MAG: helix-turn-helix domain containing protein [Candidatus Omnitrophica bacterium]|jgi:hypothetical protein|nr:helix-turn-helix domain containing protein [Candidatus Omnitrophota bacterium]